MAHKLIRLALVSALIAGCLTMASPASAAVTTFYVGCSAQANDTNDGRSTLTPWRTLTRANKNAMVPGDRLKIARGCTWVGQRIEAAWHGTALSPIVISAYGTGTAPLIKDGVNQNVRVTGSYQVIDGLAVTATPTSYTSCGQPIGNHYGFNVQPGAHHNTIQNSSAYGEMAGIHIATGATDNKILRNELHHNGMLTAFNVDPEIDNGAWGVLLNGDGTEVAYNSFHDNQAVCRNQGWVLRSKSINIYAARNSSIHHNLSTDRVFAELGSSRTVQTFGTRFTYNMFVSAHVDSRFVTTRGAGDLRWGPVLNTHVTHNTTYQTGTGSQGIVCGLGCNWTVLVTDSNVIWAEWKGIYADGDFPDRKNLFWSTTGTPLLDFPGVDATSHVANPKFVNPAAMNFRVQATSPVVDAGNTTAGWTTDFYGRVAPLGASADRGASEHQGT